MSPKKDSREVITPDAFRVAPELLGTPLARPWRRAVAMLVDLLLLALLVNAGGVLLALGAAVALFVATSRKTGSIASRAMRVVVRGVASLILFITMLSVVDAIADRFRDDDAGGGPARVRAELSDRERRELGEAFDELEQQGILPADSRRAIEDAMAAPSANEALEPDSAGAAPEDSLADLSTDALLDSFVAARAAADTAAAARVQAHLGSRLAADSLARLESELADVRDDLADADEDLADARAEVERRSGFLSMLGRMLEDLGLGLGWSGLYFTAFLALWKQQTPGKRLMKIRVIRLDGKRIGWWASFERFGGYVASVATGMLGFLQILWDGNRQAIHDKISDTVVVRVSGRDS